MHFPKNCLKNILPLLFFFTLAACEEPYTPEVLEQDNNYLVVSGFINSNGPTTIKLSHTQNLTDASGPTLETRASVTVEEESGAKYNLQETEPGTYTHRLLPITLSKKYRLVIRTGGKDYASDYVEPRITPAIDKLNWTAENDGLQLYVNTHDNENDTRYYRWEFEETWEYAAFYFSVLEYVNGQIRDREPGNDIFLCWRHNTSSAIQVGNTVKLSQDVVSNFPIVKVPANSEKLKRKYSLLVKQYAQTKESYEYWEALKKNTESIGSLFDPLPTQLTGNIQCLTSPTEPVIGFVTISSVEEKRIFVTRQELPASYRPPSQFCPFDTVKVGEEAAYFSSGGAIPIDMIISETRELIGYAGASKSCVDCRVFGTKVRPAYWQ
ncbi:DUF4249 domain-containing protein [Rufibacter tibetensis]|uniref:DUF4249 domain-containing protein n=1 Tax=Rufibacter tibetensis TaxID=512763 RepID=A0A0P0C5M7_9BACT|nr:DUF4249 domain-containing protein [Rufibacter tibetensis]ALJ00251.1 hypothetical protein DC20_16330 [Rufibacter tibetensis]